MWWEPRQEAKKRCKVPEKTGWYKCEECHEEREKIEIDHIEPVVLPEVGFTTWDDYIASKFVTSDKLRGLCRECHKQKSKEENKIRREIKKRSK
jgi:hypothetical protein